MQLGIFAKTFPGTDPAAVLAAARDAGFATTQFNLACAGLPAMPDAVPPEAIARIRAASASTGVALAALSGTYNMAHPDPAVRADGLRRLGVVIAAAAALAVPLVTLCTGTRDPEDQWAHHPDNADPSAWADMAAEIAQALDLAERHGVDLGIEPEQANIVTSAPDAVRLIAELGSPRLRIVLDPANLFERADPDAARGHRRAGRRAQRRPYRHGPRQGPPPPTAASPPPARASSTSRDFIARLRGIGFDGPLVTHGLAAAEAPAVAAFLKGLL